MYRTIAALFGISITVAASALVVTITSFDARAAGGYQKVASVIVAGE